MVLLLGSAMGYSARAYAVAPGSAVSMDKLVVARSNEVLKGKLSLNISPDNLAQSVLFENFSAGSDIKEAPVTSLFLDIPLKKAVAAAQSKLPLGFSLTLRGFVEVPATGFASLTAILGGETQTLVFPYGNAREGYFEKQMFFLFKSDQKGGQAVSDALSAQIVLNVEKLKKDHVNLSLDSLDLEIF